MTDHNGFRCQELSDDWRIFTVERYGVRYYGSCQITGPHYATTLTRSVEEAIYHAKKYKTATPYLPTEESPQSESSQLALFDENGECTLPEMSELERAQYREREEQLAQSDLSLTFDEQGNPIF